MWMMRMDMHVCKVVETGHGVVESSTSYLQLMARQLCLDWYCIDSNEVDDLLYKH